MKEYFGDSTGRYYSDVMDIADTRPLLCDRCLAIFERHVSGDGAEFCRKCEAKLAAVLDAARELRNGIDFGGAHGAQGELATPSRVGHETCGAGRSCPKRGCGLAIRGWRPYFLSGAASGVESSSSTPTRFRHGLQVKEAAPENRFRDFLGRNFTKRLGKREGRGRFSHQNALFV